MKGHLYATPWQLLIPLASVNGPGWQWWHNGVVSRRVWRRLSLESGRAYLNGHWMLDLRPLPNRQKNPNHISYSSPRTSLAFNMVGLSLWWRLKIEADSLPYKSTPDSGCSSFDKSPQGVSVDFTSLSSGPNLRKIWHQDPHHILYSSPRTSLALNMVGSSLSLRLS